MKSWTLKEMLGKGASIPSKTKLVQFPLLNDQLTIYYTGQQQCSYVTEQTKRLLDIIALNMFVKFPDRKDRRLSVGTFCPTPATSTCEGHPAHQGGWRGDFNYFTFGKNTTQWPAPWMEISQKTEKGLHWYKVDQEMIWENPIEGKQLLPMFDWERNFLFWYWVIDSLPHAEVLISSGIYSRIRSKANEKYPKQWTQCQRQIIDTGRTNLNHHLHNHGDFGTSNRPDGFDIDWDKPRDWLTC